MLARWWRGDGSIRWVLVDCQADIAAGRTQRFVLTDAKLPAPTPRHKLVVTQTQDRIVVTTGPARFVIPRRRFALLDAAAVDADGNGRFTEDEQLLATTPECGTVLEDAFGERYYSSEGTRSVEVIERGPLRVRVRARGVHRARGGKGYSRGMYGYDYFMDFHAGATTVFCDVIVGNNFAKSAGAPCFEDASLWLKLRGPLAGCSIAGHKAEPQAATLAKGESICLYQDSNGAETWQRCQGYNTERRPYWRFPAGKTASFRGYEVWLRRGPGPKRIGGGDQAVGTTHVRTDRGGLIVHLLNFWQQFPKGMEVLADGRVRVALLPREYKVRHFLEDASAKGHEIVLHFYANRRDGGRPDARRMAEIWSAKIQPRPVDVRHIAAAGALADLGPFTVPTEGMDERPSTRTEAHGPRMLTTHGLYGNAYGWQVFGDRWRSCGGHSSRAARQPMKEDNYLYRWLVTGTHGWLLTGDVRSRHFRDVRCYRVEDVDPFRYKDWDDFRSHNRSEDWTGRPQPTDDEARKYARGRYHRATFWLPNPAHMTMDLVYDRYLLTGDPRSLENLRIIAAHGGYYAACRTPVVHRATGWSWRALYRYWELTGDRDADRMMKRCIGSFKKMAEGAIALPPRRDRRTGKAGINWWFTYVFSRAAAMTALHTGHADALFICKRMAETIAAKREKYGGYSSRDFAELHAVLYHLTGEAKYRALGLGEDKGEGLKVLRASMTLPACAHWLLHQPTEVRQRR